MVRELVVRLLQAVDHARLTGLLADGQMDEAGDRTIRGVDFDDLLEASDHDHVTIQLQQSFIGKCHLISSYIL